MVSCYGKRSTACTLLLYSPCTVGTHTMYMQEEEYYIHSLLCIHSVRGCAIMDARPLFLLHHHVEETIRRCSIPSWVRIQGYHPLGMHGEEGLRYPLHHA
jgi:hypothetical protein